MENGRRRSDSSRMQTGVEAQHVALSILFILHLFESGPGVLDRKTPKNNISSVTNLGSLDPRDPESRPIGDERRFKRHSH